MAAPGPAGALSVADTRAENRNRTVDEHFAQVPTVLRDDAGLATSRLFFDDSDTVVIAGPSDAAQLRAASIAVFTHAPMLSYSRPRHAEIVAEIGRLGATRILTVGAVELAETTGVVTVTADPGTDAGLGDLTAHQFHDAVVRDPAGMVGAVASLDGSTPVLLTAGWETLPPRPGPTAAFPISSRRDAQRAPTTVATAASPLVSVTNARSFGASVRVVDTPDPRESEETMRAMVGLADRPLLALGEQFGSGPTLADSIVQAEQKLLRKIR
ncbi:hypothetical protein CGUA_05845 [Corynebacterium guangdongense]|nr:hypothetical protein CGUA_05845 [Corynebacterium guangdongense]